MIYLAVLRAPQAQFFSNTCGFKTSCSANHAPTLSHVARPQAGLQLPQGEHVMHGYAVHLHADHLHAIEDAAHHMMYLFLHQLCPLTKPIESTNSLFLFVHAAAVCQRTKIICLQGAFSPGWPEHHRLWPSCTPGGCRLLGDTPPVVVSTDARIRLLAGAIGPGALSH